MQEYEVEDDDVEDDDVEEDEDEDDNVEDEVEDDEVGEDDEKDDKVAEEKVDDDGDDDDDVAEDEVENDHVEDDDVKGEEDDDVEEEEEDDEVEGRTDPKTAAHTLCEPAQSKCTSSHHKSHFLCEFTGKMPQTKTGDRACAVEMHLDVSQEPLYTEICSKNARAQNRDANFVRACTVEMHLEISQEPLDAEIDRENAAAQSEHLDQTPAYTATARTPGIKDYNIFHNTVEIYIDIYIYTNNMYKNNRSDIKETKQFYLDSMAIRHVACGLLRRPQQRRRGSTGRRWRLQEWRLCRRCQWN